MFLKISTNALYFLAEFYWTWKPKLQQGFSELSTSTAKTFGWQREKHMKSKRALNKRTRWLWNNIEARWISQLIPRTFSPRWDVKSTQHFSQNISRRVSCEKQKELWDVDSEKISGILLIFERQLPVHHRPPLDHNGSCEKSAGEFAKQFGNNIPVISDEN